MTELLRLEEVKIDFAAKDCPIHAVRGVSFELQAGETLALVGQSGCGKTVLAKSLLGLLCQKAKVSGKAFFADEDLFSLSEQKLQALRGSDIALVAQDPQSSLSPTYSVGRQIMETLLLHQHISKKTAREQALDWLDQVGIARPKDSFDLYPHQLSGGMRQRVVLAMALCCSPRLLIADEPTTALDATTQAHILRLLKRLQEASGAAMLFITHDLAVAAEVAQSVAVMQDGLIVEKGAAAAVLRYPQHPYSQSLVAAF